MKIYDGVHEVKSVPNKSIVTIGNFDGVHLGHRQIFSRMRELSKSTGGPSIVMTFHPHPRQVLTPQSNFGRIFGFDDQRKELEKIGVDILVVEPFSRDLSEVPPEKFIQDWIVTRLGVENLIVGYDFSFGANRAGSLSLLKEVSERLGFKLEVIPAFGLGTEVVSSSRIRQAVSDGDVELAYRMLGRRFYLEGIVEKGVGRGTTIGIPTANLKAAFETFPRPGVYATGLTIKSRNLTYSAVTNVGFNPTFLPSHPGLLPGPKIETHILDFQDRIYGETIKIEFISRLREEKKFSGAEELVAQIRKDIEQARKILSERKDT